MERFAPSVHGHSPYDTKPQTGELDVPARPEAVRLVSVHPHPTAQQQCPSTCPSAPLRSSRSGQYSPAPSGSILKVLSLPTSPGFNRPKLFALNQAMCGILLRLCGIEVRRQHETEEV